MPDIPWTESRVVSTHVYQDDTDRFELVTVERPTRGTEVEYQVCEEWRPLDTPSVLHHRTLYRGRSLAAAHDARDREMSYIHETKRRGGRLVMRARATRYDRPPIHKTPPERCDPLAGFTSAEKAAIYGTIDSIERGEAARNGGGE